MRVKNTFCGQECRKYIQNKYIGLSYAKKLNFKFYLNEVLTKEVTNSERTICGSWGWYEMATIIPVTVALFLTLCWTLILKQRTRIDYKIYSFMSKKQSWVPRVFQLSNIAVSIFLLKLLIEFPYLQYGEYLNSVIFIGICVVYIISMMITVGAQKALKNKRSK